MEKERKRERRRERDERANRRKHEKEREREKETFSCRGKAEIPSSVDSKGRRSERVVEGELKLGWEGGGKGDKVPPWNTLTAGRRGI